MSRLVRVTAWRVLARREMRPFDAPAPWSVIGVTPGTLVVAVAVALVIGLALGATVRGAVSSRMVALEASTAPPTAGPIPRLARWPVEPVERPSPPTPSAAVEPTGARSEPSLPARSGHTAKGWATWYATGPDCLCAAAGPALRVGNWRGRWVTVNGWLRVRLVDACQCYRGTARERLIDLSDEAFQKLAPLSRGVIWTEVSW